MKRLRPWLRAAVLVLLRWEFPGESFSAYTLLYSNFVAFVGVFPA